MTPIDLTTTVRSRLSKSFGRFRRAQDGSVFVLFGFAALPVMAISGAAVDYARVHQARSHLQNAVDSAALAAVTTRSQGGDADSTAVKYVAAQLPTYTPATVVTVNALQGTVKVASSISVEPVMLKVVGLGATTVSAQATAAQGAATGGGVSEFAIALDTTGSMKGVKLATAQSAAATLVDTLFKLPGTTALNPNVKAGLVPFDFYVNVGTTYRGASWLTNTTDYSVTNAPTCSNTYPDKKLISHVWTTATCKSDGVPYDCSRYVDTYDYGTAVKVCNNGSTSNYKWYGCVGSQPSPYDIGEIANATNPVPGMLNVSCSSPLIRLTNDAAALKKAIAATKAANETYIAPALMWAWRLLSPNSPFSGDAGAYGAAQKTIVLMTDGANTHSPKYPGHEGTDVNLANSRLTDLCKNVKASGVTIYTIAFSVTDTTIKNLLSSCSSGPPYYYNAQTTDDLTAAFASIGAQLTAVRLVN